MPLPGLTHDEHEALCRRCGISCHYAVPVNGLPVVVDELHCKFLGKDDAGKFGCTVYEDRFARAPWCASAEQALQDGLLAQDCPYARGVRGYRGKTHLHPRLLKQALPAIRRELLQNGAPIGLDLDGLQAFLARTGGGEFRFVMHSDHVEIQAVVAESDGVDDPGTDED